MKVIERLLEDFHLIRGTDFNLDFLELAGTYGINGRMAKIAERLYRST